MNKVIKVANSLKKRLFKKSYSGIHELTKGIDNSITELFKILKEEIEDIKKDNYHYDISDFDGFEKHILFIEEKMIEVFREPKDYSLTDFSYMKSLVRELIFVIEKNERVFSKSVFNSIMSLLYKLNEDLDNMRYDFDTDSPYKL